MKESNQKQNGKVRRRPFCPHLLISGLPARLNETYTIGLLSTQCRRKSSKDNGQRNLHGRKILTSGVSCECEDTDVHSNSRAKILIYKVGAEISAHSKFGLCQDDSIFYRPVGLASGLQHTRALHINRTRNRNRCKTYVHQMKSDFTGGSVPSWSWTAAPPHPLGNQASGGQCQVLQSVTEEH